MPGKKFRFSLDSVLKVRRHETERARQELSQALNTTQQQENRVLEAKAHLASTAASSPASGAVDPMALRRHAAHRADAQRALDRDSKRLERLRMAEAKARAALVKKRQAEEALQTLHDQEQAQHLQEHHAAETAFLDEQAIISHYRNQQVPDS